MSEMLMRFLPATDVFDEYYVSISLYNAEICIVRTHSDCLLINSTVNDRIYLQLFFILLLRSVWLKHM